MNQTVHHDPTVPRGALIGAATVLLFTMAVTGAVSLGFIPQSADPTASRVAANVKPEQTRMLRFVDRADGAVVVSDAASGDVVKVIEFGQGGFLRATMRRLAKTRKASNIGAEPAFELTLWENGALSLKDPETGREVEIHGFGSDHSKIFADMLKDPAA
ncbi:photosynthetic complex assembly protein PuhC [Sphingorhabdus sp.]|uniref:photosynthetic complex assembly protein PuhC n=1 Tax=Sphingorhabdus sp. TaxID=1902408 RepID=UPI0035943A02